MAATTERAISAAGASGECSSWCGTRRRQLDAGRQQFVSSVGVPGSR